MSRIQKRKQQTRRRKQMAVRNRIRVGNDRPRLSVRRSLTNIYCQIIDDENGRTLCAASSCDKELRPQLTNMRKTDVATKVGALIAERAKAAGVVRVAFDRSHYKYHGRVRALAEAAREGGLEF